MSTITYGPSIIAQNVLLNNTASYRNLIVQGGSLVPSSSNSQIILQWINSKLTKLNSLWLTNLRYNNISGPTTPYVGGVLVPDGRVIFSPGGSNNIGVYNPSTNIFSTLLSGSVTGGNAYLAGCLMPDGRVLFANYAVANIGLFNPSSGSFTTFSTNVVSGYGYGAAVVGDGRVVLCPASSSSVGVFNPNTNSFVSYASGAAGFGSFNYSGSVLMPDGRVVFVPSNATNVGVFDPTTNQYTTYAYSGTAGVNVPAGSSAYFGGVVLPDGRVIFVPANAQNVGVFNFATNSFSTVAFSGTPGSTIPGGSGAYATGCLLPDGRVLFASQNATNLGLFNPYTNTFATFASGGTGLGANAYQGATLLPDGRVVLVSVSANKVGIVTGGATTVSSDLCMHPMFNKL